MRAVTFIGAGDNDVIRVTERPDPDPVGEEVLVAVTYAGINPADLQQREGRYPPPAGVPADIPGLEVAGEVIACGSRVLRWKVGDRVFGLVAGGGLANRVLVHERCLAPVPDRLDDAAAAAVPEVFMTAHDAIRSQADLTMGEILLVHGANGGVGGAALQIGAMTGARVLAVSRHRPTDAGDAGGRVTWIDDDGFADQVLHATNGRGADVILEVVGAPHFPANFDALAAGGRIIVVGVAAGSRSDIPLIKLMQKRASIRGTVLRSRSLEDKAAVVRAFEREVLPALAAGEMAPIIDRVFDVDGVAAAFDHLASQGKHGKVLVQFS
ncbi:MAG: zinc-binding dehydrogenase [Nitriliruptoraceae bacterium]